MSQPPGQFDIVGIGASTIDTFYLVDEFPAAEGVYESGTSIVSGGGPVSTALAAAASLGSRVAMCDRIGNDWRSDQILHEFHQFGVDTSAIFRENGSLSSSATVLVRRRDGARAITFTRATCSELDVDQIPAELVANSKILHLNGRHFQAAMRACEIAEENNVLVSFDGGANRFGPSSRKYVERSDVCIVALDFARQFSGIEDDIEKMTSVFFQESPANIVVITSGSEGSWISERGVNAFHQPATPARNVIDTTGCGDVYHGAFLHALVQRKSLFEAAQQASDLAARTCELLGGRSALARTS